MASRRHRRMGAIEGTLTVFATIFCLPCICLIGGGIVAKDMFKKAKDYEQPEKRKAREAAEKKKKLIRATPRILAPRLERHLTIGRPEREEKIDEVGLVETKEVVEPKLSRTLTVTHEQMESPLFRLPWEIRRKIYEEALGGHMIHIYFVEAYRRMSHTRCKPDLPEICEEVYNVGWCMQCVGPPCRNHAKVPGAADEWGNVNLLALLQSCRKIYSETIELLYTENYFDFDDMGDALKLSLTLLPERMRLIQDVRWNRGYDDSHSHEPVWLQWCGRSNPCYCVNCWPKAVGLVASGRPA